MRNYVECYRNVIFRSKKIWIKAQVRRVCPFIQATIRSVKDKICQVVDLIYLNTHRTYRGPTYHVFKRISESCELYLDKWLPNIGIHKPSLPQYVCVEHILAALNYKGSIEIIETEGRMRMACPVFAYWRHLEIKPWSIISQLLHENNHMLCPVIETEVILDSRGGFYCPRARMKCMQVPHFYFVSYAISNWTSSNISSMKRVRQAKFALRSHKTVAWKIRNKT